MDLTISASSGTETSPKAGSDLNVVRRNYPVGSVLGGGACRGGSGMRTGEARAAMLSGVNFLLKGRGQEKGHAKGGCCFFVMCLVGGCCADLRQVFVVHAGWKSEQTLRLVG
ncbi:hypothetical protein O3P69_002181 [Scylla paramamosain]|uniref:Uncharacterized protein n=1 Tax=Scylla paramamosain TaxID=85552 RepID=A0AAW0V550_SCYPA